MSTSALARKLLIKPNFRVAVVNPPEGYTGSLQPLPEGAELLERSGEEADPKGGRKAGTDLHRDVLWELMGREGLTGVTLVAIDGTWSAMRFRPTAEVGT